MTEEKDSTGTAGPHVSGPHVNEPHVNEPRRTPVNSGNPRITVAFPLSRIDIREPSEALRDLAAMVEQLATQVAALTREVTPTQGEASDRLAAQAALLAGRMGSDA